MAPQPSILIMLMTADKAHQQNRKHSPGHSESQEVNFKSPNRLDAMMNRLQLWQKFMLLGMVAFLMLSVPVWLLVSKAQEEKTFAAKEASGIDYVGKTLRLMQLLQQHRGLSAVVLSGNNNEKANWQIVRAEINQQINAIEALDAHLSKLGMTPAWQGMRNQWQNLESDAEALSVADSFAKHSALIESVLAFNRKLLDNTNVNLDPVIGTYYLGQLSFDLLPKTAEILGQMRGIGSPILNRKQVTPIEAASLHQLAKSLAYQLNLINESLAKIDVIDNLTRTEVLKYINSAKQAADLTESQIINSGKFELTGKDYFSKLTETINLNFSMTGRASEQFLTAIDKRITDINQLNLTVLVAVLIGIGGFISLSWFTVSGVIRPVKSTIDAISQLGRGEMPETDTTNYGLEFNQLRDGLNSAVAAIKLLAEDAGELSEAAVQGRLSVRADASRHQGDFRKIVEGINATVDGVVLPLNDAAAHVFNISKGEISTKVSGNYSGDFDTLKTNLNTCLDALNGLTDEIAAMARQHSQGEIDAKIDEARFHGSYQAIAKCINEMVFEHIATKKKAVACLTAFGEGDMDAAIESFPGKKRFINDSIEQVRTNIKALISDTTQLSQAAVEGNLTVRADTGKHHGDFRKIIEGFNNTLDAVIGPLNVAADYVDNIAKGNLPEKIADNYQGDFKPIKNNLNSLIGTLNEFEVAQQKMWDEHAAGNIDYVISAAQFNGVYQRIANSINELVASHIAVKMRVVDVVKHYAEGDFTQDMDRLPGKKAQITQAIDGVKQNLQSMQSEIMVLVKEAVDGNLSARADSSKFNYDFKAMLDGINQTLDAVVVPLNVAAKYVADISRGEIPARITDSYNGDFNVIKNNLNTCIDAINALVEDTMILSRDAVEGKLTSRADAGKHQGDYRRIVEGINATLDGVILPLNEAMEVLTFVEQGDLTYKISGDYKGQLRSFKETVNNTIAKLSKTITEVAGSAEQLNSAADQINATSQSLSQSANEQAASVEETSASIEQMASSIFQNSENAKVTDAMAGKAAKEAEEGGAAVKNTVEAMKKIADKIGIIDDIAYQTNMLALNAAIEAARAGDHGKGFAVVAAEVRKLAERSQVAAHEIGELAVSSVKTAENAGKLLDEIVPSIGKTSDLVQEIAAASQEQSLGVSQINTAVGQMNQITQQNAAASEELASTADLMSSQTEQLQLLMSFFKVKTAKNQTVQLKGKPATPSGQHKPIPVKPEYQGVVEASFDMRKFEHF